VRLVLLRGNAKPITFRHPSKNTSVELFCGNRDVCNVLFEI